MADDRAKLDGQRRAIREHIEKFERYPIPHDKAFALKTIANCQGQIRAIRSRKPHLPPSWEDDWKPPPSSGAPPHAG